MNVQKYRLIAGVYVVLTSKKAALWVNNCRSFGIKQVSSSCCISNAHSR